MPLTQLVERFNDYPVNVAAIPKTAWLISFHKRFNGHRELSTKPFPEPWLNEVVVV